MFINFWYPAEESKNVTAEKPLKVQMLGLSFVLWRDTKGRAHCAHNTCTHRGGSLGDGKVVGDCIQCPYHGWKFNGEGGCERIPSLGPLDKFPPRSRLDAYPVEERYGLVFVFLGDLPESERPTIMPCNEYEQDGWRTLRMRYRWKASYVRLVENQSDPSHVEYVHGGMGLAGADSNYKVPKINIEKTSPWGAGAMVVFQSPALPDEQMRKLQENETRNESGSGYHGAACTWTRVNFSPTNKMHLYLYTVPRDELDLELFLIMNRNCMLEEARDENFMKRMGVAVEEDRVVVEKLDPAVPSKEALGEFIIPADDIIMHYRGQLIDWQKRGWRMDVEALHRNRGRVAYSIPSPARRANPGDWAVTPVPMLRG